MVWWIICGRSRSETRSVANSSRCRHRRLTQCSLQVLSSVDACIYYWGSESTGLRSIRNNRLVGWWPTRAVISTLSDLAAFSRRRYRRNSFAPLRNYLKPPPMLPAFRESCACDGQLVKCRWVGCGRPFWRSGFLWHTKLWIGHEISVATVGYVRSYDDWKFQ